jgi:uncharacterized membrane protein
MCKKIDRLFLLFLLYSIFGWLYEVFLEVVIYRWGYSDRGVLTGPYCPIYGMGAMLFLLCFSGFLRADLRGIARYLRPPAVFLGCMALATALELAASYILEEITGTWPWQTYLDYRINFQGRIALSPSLRFGVGGLLFLYVLQPLFARLLDRLGARRVHSLARLTGALFLLDIVHYAWSLLS